jgi:hypothetical protein
MVNQLMNNGKRKKHCPLSSNKLTSIILVALALFAAVFYLRPVVAPFFAVLKG